MDCVPDLRLILLGKPDAFGIASALNVENARIAPAMFVVADKPAAGIGGKGGLSCAA